MSGSVIDYASFLLAVRTYPDKVQVPVFVGLCVIVADEPLSLVANPNATVGSLGNA